MNNITNVVAIHSVDIIKQLLAISEVLGEPVPPIDISKAVNDEVLNKYLTVVEKGGHISKGTDLRTFRVYMTTNKVYERGIDDAAWKNERAWDSAYATVKIPTACVSGEETEEELYVILRTVLKSQCIGKDSSFTVMDEWLEMFGGEPLTKEDWDKWHKDGTVF